MIKSLQTSFRVYVRSGRLLIPWLALFAATEYYLYSEYRYDLAPVSFLTLSLKVGILFVVYFLFAGYELGSCLQRAGGRECIAAVRGAELRLLGAHILTLLLPLGIWSLSVFLWQAAACFLRQVGYPPFIGHCFRAVLLYCFFPGMIAALIGVCLSGKNRPAAYGLMILFTLLFSPFAAKLFSGADISGVSVMIVMDWFALSVPNATWIADGIYGISMEMCRWVLAAFWIVALAALLLWKHRKAGKGIRFAALIFTLAAVVCGGRFAARGGDYLLQKDNRPDGILRSESGYRRANAAGEEEEADFSVAAYKLEFKMKDCLSATAVLRLEESDRTEYAFTLYHGLKVSSVEDENGNALTWSRDGDFLDIETDGSVQSLKIRYSGKTWKYYANRQGIALPGYLPYYPVPGHLLLWDYSRSSMVVHTDFHPSEFEVTVDSGLEVISNLPKTGRNRFSGRAQAVSLYGGMIAEEEKNGNVCYYSPVEDRRVNLNAAEISQEWKRLCLLLGETRELETAGKMIILQPLTTEAIGANHEVFAVFDDHILLTGYNPAPDMICQFYLMEIIPDHPETGMLKEELGKYLLSSEVRYDGEKPAYEDMNLLKKYHSHGEIKDRDEWSLYLEQKNGTYAQLFSYQCSALGTEYVLREVYRYLTAEERLLDQVDFLYGLGR